MNGNKAATIDQTPELAFTLAERRALDDGYRHYGPAFMTAILPLYVQMRDAHGFPVKYFKMVANFPVLDTIGKRVIGDDYSNLAFNPPTTIMHDIPNDVLIDIIERHLRYHQWILDYNASIGHPMKVSEDGIMERLREASNDIRDIARTTFF